MFIIRVIADKKFSKYSGITPIPFYIGFALVAIGACLGGDYGFALNPVNEFKGNKYSSINLSFCIPQARDLGPRIISSLGGW